MDDIVNDITLLKNNDQRECTDVEWINEFYNFLQGVDPDDIKPAKGNGLNLSHKKAFLIIYYLQEHFPIFPDHIELCWNCKELFDTESEGLYWETKYRHYCGHCDYLVPENYDNCKRKLLFTRG